MAHGIKYFARIQDKSINNLPERAVICSIARDSYTGVQGEFTSLARNPLTKSIIGGDKISPVIGSSMSLTVNQFEDYKYDEFIGADDRDFKMKVSRQSATESQLGIGTALQPGPTTIGGATTIGNLYRIGYQGTGWTPTESFVVQYATSNQKILSDVSNVLTTESYVWFISDKAEAIEFDLSGASTDVDIEIIEYPMATEWVGWVTAGIYNEPYEQAPYPFTVRATDGLSDLQNIDYLDSNGDRYSDGLVTVNEVLSIILNDKLALGLNIKENMNIGGEIPFNSQITSSENFFSQSQVSHEMLYNDDIAKTPRNCLEILEGLMTWGLCSMYQIPGNKVMIEQVHISDAPYLYREWDTAGTTLVDSGTEHPIKHLGKRGGLPAGIFPPSDINIIEGRGSVYIEPAITKLVYTQDTGYQKNIFAGVNFTEDDFSDATTLIHWGGQTFFSLFSATADVDRVAFLNDYILNINGSVSTRNPITGSYSNGGGGVTNVQDNSHGLSTNDIIYIDYVRENGKQLGANYKGQHKVTVVDPNNFTIPVPFTSDDAGTSDSYFIKINDNTLIKGLEQRFNAQGIGTFASWDDAQAIGEKFVLKISVRLSTTDTFDENFKSYLPIMFAADEVITDVFLQNLVDNDESTEIDTVFGTDEVWVLLNLKNKPNEWQDISLEISIDGLGTDVASYFAIGQVHTQYTSSSLDVSSLSIQLEPELSPVNPQEEYSNNLLPIGSVTVKEINQEWSTTANNEFYNFPGSSQRFFCTPSGIPYINLIAWYNEEGDEINHQDILQRLWKRPSMVITTQVEGELEYYNKIIDKFSKSRLYQIRDLTTHYKYNRHEVTLVEVLPAPDPVLEGEHSFWASRFEGNNNSVNALVDMGRQAKSNTNAYFLEGSKVSMKTDGQGIPYLDITADKGIYKSDYTEIADTYNIWTVVKAKVLSGSRYLFDGVNDTTNRHGLVFATTIGTNMLLSYDTISTADTLYDPVLEELVIINIEIASGAATKVYVNNTLTATLTITPKHSIGVILFGNEAGTAGPEHHFYYWMIDSGSLTTTERAERHRKLSALFQKAPTIQEAYVENDNPDKILVKFSERMDTVDVLGWGLEFYSGTPKTISSMAIVSGTDNTVAEFTLSGDIEEGDIINITYDPSTGVNTLNERGQEQIELLSRDLGGQYKVDNQVQAVTEDADATTWLNGLTATPTTAEREAYSNLFTALKAGNNNYSELIYLGVYYTTSNIAQEGALRDIIGTTNGSFFGGTPATWSAKSGIVRGGAFSGMDTGVDPELDAKFSANFGSHGLMWSSVSGTDGATSRAMGGWTASQDASISNDNAGNRTVHRFYGSTLLPAGLAVNDALYSTIKSGFPGTVKSYKGGTESASAGSGSGTSISKAWYILSPNGILSSFTLGTVSFAFIGSKDVDTGELETALLNFKTAIDAI